MTWTEALASMKKLGLDGSCGSADGSLEDFSDAAMCEINLVHSFLKGRVCFFGQVPAREADEALSLSVFTAVES